MIDAHIEAVKAKGRKSWQQKRDMLTRLVKPRLGNRPIRSVTRKDLVQLVDGINAERGSNIARAAFAHFSAVLRWADGKDLIDVFPARNIELPAVIASRDRVLDDAELSVVLESIRRMPYPAGPFLMMLLLSSQRRNEIAGLSRSEVDLPGRQITLPAVRMKAGRSHSIPTTDAMMQVITSLPVQAQFLFSMDGGKTPIAAFSRIKHRLDQQVLIVLKERGLPPLPHFTLHDLRRTARTVLGTLGCPRDHAELLLAHKLGDEITATYNHSTHTKQKREALTMWQDHLLGLTKSPQVKVTA